MMTRGHDGTARTPTADDASRADPRRLRRALAPFVRGTTVRSSKQLLTTFIAFLGLEAALYASLGISYWLTLALALPTAGFVVRIFIIQHDCGHRSFLPTRVGNVLVGRLCSLATLTPFAHWRRQHAGHHAVWNNLDRRESGVDFYSTCLTVDEYLALSPWRRLRYRLIQHPAVSLLLVPPLIFVVLYRFAFDTPRDWRAERASVHLTNLALAATYGGLGLALGFGAVAAVQLPVIALAAIAGVWLFSVQHRFEAARWSRARRWDPVVAALQGSSHLALPRPLEWLSGHIGLHHVHHLASRIPNYRLAEAHRALAELVALPAPLLLTRALGASRFALWDEANGRMARFPRAGAVGEGSAIGHEAAGGIANRRGPE